jgi:hypothetical protein
MKLTTHTTNKEQNKPLPNSPEELKKIIRQKDVELASQQKRARRLKWQRKALLYILGLVILAGAYFFAFKVTESFWLKNLVVSASPHVHKAQAKEIAVEAEKPKTYNIPQIVDAVHILESSGGRKDGCVSRGEGVNGFGFAQHGSGDVWNCYKNYAQVRMLVEQWFAEKVPAMGLPTALCYYNTGYQKADCPYYQNFLKVVES